ncbi:hypothetical protein S40288_07302 [Stachybotrys chartarum IBT 40288]|nr:hypothetical protein S40288_07302 [Stachybotrys chartarum IBT 40288]
MSSWSHDDYADHASDSTDLYPAAETLAERQQIAKHMHVISHDARLLHRLARRQIQSRNRHRTVTDEEDLATMHTLNKNIKRQLDEVTHPDSPPHDNASAAKQSKFDGHVPTKRARTHKALDCYVGKSNCPEQAKMTWVRSCRVCGTTETPRWRGNPSEMDPLCNVCGLLEKKRTGRKHAEVAEFINSQWSHRQR